MCAKLDRPWGGVWGLDAAMDRRLQRPRDRGVTMVIDTGLGRTATADLLEISGAHIDHWKFGFGTSALMPPHVLRGKLELLADYDVLTYPGGTLLEASIVQQHCRVFMRRARELGFRAVEISDGTISLPGDRRRRVIDCALNAGLIAITEVGKKDPTHQPEASELAEQALNDIEWGAEWVVVEAREFGLRHWNFRQGRRDTRRLPRRHCGAGRRRRRPPDLGGAAQGPAGGAREALWRQCRPRKYFG